jgi:cell division protein FtsL
MINTSEQILVIFLSLALVVLLVIAIVVAVYAVRLLKAANRIAEKTEHVAEKAENIGAMLTKVTTSTAAFRIIKTMFNVATKNSRQRKSEK